MGGFVFSPTIHLHALIEKLCTKIIDVKDIQREEVRFGQIHQGLLCLVRHGLFENLEREDKRAILFLSLQMLRFPSAAASRRL